MIEKHVEIGIGEVFVTNQPVVISTILGSCVSVCIYSEQTCVGGMIHFALPDKSFTHNSERSEYNFGDLAIHELLKRIIEYPGVDPRYLKAKITGGSEALGVTSVGTKNIKKARDILTTLGIRVVSEHVGGEKGRKIYFYNQSGRLRVALLEKHLSQTLMTKKLKVLVIDDNSLTQGLLGKMLSSPEIEIAGFASDAKEGEMLIKMLSPDVILLDIHLGGPDGISLLRKYMPSHPIPTLMLTSAEHGETETVLKALELGAVDYIQKDLLKEDSIQVELIREKVKVTSAVKFSRKDISLKKSDVSEDVLVSSFGKILAIGASTGGTQAIKNLLLQLPAGIPGIVIVQHIPPVFSTAFAKQLNDVCLFEVKEAEDGDEIRRNRVLLAPGGRQMEIVKKFGKLSVRVFDGEKVNRHRPSVDVLFHSIAKISGKDAMGIILTGMGNDGAAGLLSMKQQGAITFVQDRDSSVVYGMPKAAYEIGAATFVHSLSGMGQAIIKTLNKAS